MSQCSSKVRTPCFSIHTFNREAQIDFDPASISFTLLIVPNLGESVPICITRKAEFSLPQCWSLSWLFHPG